MHAGKCAAALIIRDVVYLKKDPGYYSATPKLGTLDAKLLERIGRTLVCDRVFDTLGVPQEERDLITSNKATPGSLDASSWSQPKKTIREAANIESKRKPSAVESAVANAATSGDMSAALNIATASKPIAETSTPPVAKPLVSPVVASAGLSLMERARLAKQGQLT
jgi:hypothetical protein